MNLVLKTVTERGLPQPDIPEPEPFSAEAAEEVNLDGFGAVIFAGGFRPNFDLWVRCPGAFDEFGFPSRRTAPTPSLTGCTSSASTSCACASPRPSFGVGEDAAIVARSIAATPEQLARA
jgi:putative flavoprotein involved in K+ transport